jgi:hypothetical protein
VCALVCLESGVKIVLLFGASACLERVLGAFGRGCERERTDQYGENQNPQWHHRRLGRTLLLLKQTLYAGDGSSSLRKVNFVIEGLRFSSALFLVFISSRKRS